MHERIIGGSLLLVAALAGCQEPEQPVEVDNRSPVLAEVPPPAITGGTLLALSDDRVLVADADRDRVHIVSISPARYDGDILFEAGAEPGRAVEGSEGLAHVVLRGAGELATIDTLGGELVERRQLCGDPRGIAFDEDSAQLFVACADGNLVVMDEDGGGADMHFVEPDLRDVVIEGGRLLISRMRSAEVLEVSMSGVLTGRRTPPRALDANPVVAWRMVKGQGEDDRVTLLHQFAATTPIPIAPPEDDTGNDDHGEDGGAPYGGGGFCMPPIVSAGVSTWEGQELVRSSQLAALTPAVDAAVRLDGKVAVASAGAPEGAPDVHITGEFDDDFCFGDNRSISTPGQPVALTFLSGSRLVVQSREPAALYVYSAALEHELTVELSSSSRFDTGHDLYHRTVDAQIACASCHPEGTDDGHVWLFEQLGPRRTQTPEVGLEGTAPFHWDGDMDDFRTLSNEVYTHRMGGPMQSEERAEAFARWIFSAERPPARSMVDADLHADGEQLFIDYGCASCHAGVRTSTNQTVAIRGKPLQVPSLRRIALRPPYMHDGRADTLRDAVLDMLDATQPDLPYTGQDVDAITAYLRTL